MNKTDLQERITKTKALITAYEDAALALASGAIESYDIDTGQTRTRVTKINIGTLDKALDALYNRCAMLDARLNGSGAITVRPSW